MPWYIYLLAFFFTYFILSGIAIMLAQAWRIYLPRTMALFFSPLWRLITPRTEKCTRCGLPFSLVASHSTTAHGGGYRTKALCQRDWAKLTPEGRVEYYKRMMELEHIDPTRWPDRQIIQAVRAGG